MHLRRGSTQQHFTLRPFLAIPASPKDPDWLPGYNQMFYYPESLKVTVIDPATDLPCPGEEKTRGQLHIHDATSLVNKKFWPCAGLGRKFANLLAAFILTREHSYESSYCS